MIRPCVAALTLALVAVPLVRGAPVGAQGGPQPQPGVVYTNAGDPLTRAVVANEQQQPTLLVEIGIAPCEELALQDALTGGGIATVDPDGTFRGIAEVGALELTEPVELELEGRFVDDRNAELTVRYDYAPTKVLDVAESSKRCKGEEQIQLVGVDDPGAQRISGVFEVPGHSLGASDDAVYVADVRRRRLTKLEASSGAEEWDVRTRLRVSSLAAGDDAAWGLGNVEQFGDRFVVRYDAGTGKETARLNFSTASRGNDPYGHIAVTPGGVWVPDADDTLYRIDPETAKVADRIPLDGVPKAMVSGPNGVYVVVEAPAGDDSTSRLLVVDDTGEVVNGVDLGDGLELSGGDALGADASRVWLAVDDATTGQTLVEQREATTLEVVAQTPQYPADAVLGIDMLAAAPPGAFANVIGVDGGFDVLDDALTTVARVPIVDVAPLEMVAAGDAVWVLEGLGLDVLVRLATG